MKTRRTVKRMTCRSALALAILLIAPLVVFQPAAADLPMFRGGETFEVPPLAERGSISARRARSSGSSSGSSSASAPYATEITPEIEAQAVALGNDVDLIFEFVYNEIAFTPLWGSHKGALGTLLDRAGGSFDQASLLVALLRAAGHNARFVYGTLELDAEQAENWLDVGQSARVADYVLVNAGFEWNWNFYTHGTDWDSPDVVGLDIDHVWVEVEIDGAYYTFDPSLKRYDVVPGIDLAQSTGFDKETFLAAALEGSAQGEDFIQDINREQLEAKLTSYTMSLVEEVRTNHSGASLEDIIGGRHVRVLGGVQRLSAHPNEKDRFETWDEIPDSMRLAVRIECEGINWASYADTLEGRRLTLWWDPDTRRPTLRLDGVARATGEKGSFGADSSMTISLDFPYTSSNGDASDRRDNSPTYGVDVGDSLAIVMASGAAGLKRRDFHLDRYSEEEGVDFDTQSEAALGESFSAVGSQYLVQTVEGSRLLSRVNGARLVFNTALMVFHSSVIRDSTGHPLGIGAWMSVNSVSASISKDPASSNGMYFLGEHSSGSALEWGSLEQLSEKNAVSTVKFFGVSNDQSTKFFDVTAENFSSVKSQLDYSSGWMSWLESRINEGYRLIVPQDGNLRIDSWTGSAVWGKGPSGELFSIGGTSGGGVANGGYLTDFKEFVLSAAATLWTNVAGVLGHPISLDPVDLYTGDFLYDHSDLSIGGGDLGRGLSYERSYNAGNRERESELGRGWGHGFGTRLEVNSDSLRPLVGGSPIDAASQIVAALVKGSLVGFSPVGADSLEDRLVTFLVGRWSMDQQINNVVSIRSIHSTEFFVKLPDGSFNSPAGSANELTKPPGALWRLRTGHGDVIDFNIRRRGGIETWADPNGNTLNFSYFSGHSPNSNFLSSVTDSAGHTLSFSYAEDPSAYGMDAALEKVSDNTGRSVEYGYDEEGNLVSFTGPEGATIRYEYDSPGLLARVIHPTNPETPSVSNEFDDSGRVVRQADSEGNVWQYFFAGSRSEEIDPRGHSRVWYFDEHGKVLREVDALGYETAQTFDGARRVTSRSLPDGQRVEYEYDSRHNRTQNTIFPASGSEEPPLVTSYTYESTFNRVTSVTDPRGFTTQYAYDEKGNLTHIVAPEVDGSAATTAFSYNDRGQVTSVTDAEGTLTQYVYDTTTGELLQTVVDAGGLNLTGSLSYDTAGNVVAQTDPRGNTTTYTYDKRRQLLATTPADPAAARTTSLYDDDGFLIAVTRRDPATGGEALTTSFDYDAAGRRTHVTDPEGNTTVKGYDDLGRPFQTIDALGRVRENRYDARGQVSQQIDGLGNAEATYSYTPGGQVQRLVDAKENETHYVYDGFGRLAETAYADGTHEEFSYDAAGHLVRHLPRRPFWAPHYSYDALGRLESKSVTNAGSFAYRYDGVGRLISASNSLGTTDHHYDGAGRLVQVEHPGGRLVGYAYDAAGNRTGVTYPTGASVAYAYDAQNRMTEVHEMGMISARYRYDAFSRRSEVFHGWSGTTTSYSYQQDGDLAKLRHVASPAGWAVDFDYSYDAAHNRIGTQVSDPAFEYELVRDVSAAYTTNELNQYTSVASVAQGFDPNGNLASDGTNHYLHDQEGRLIRVTTPTWEYVDYGYDALGRRTQRSFRDETTYTVYDGLRPLVEYDAAGTALRTYIYGAGPDEAVGFWTGGERYSLHHDGQGSVVALTDDMSNRVEHYRYGPFGETEGVSVLGNPIRYTGRFYDAATGLYDNRLRNYHPVLGRFIEPDPIGPAGGINLYAYVNSNPINFIDPLGLSAMDNGGYGSGQGEKSYIVSRPLGGGSEWLSHNFIVIGADFIGDPNATVTSHGSNAQGYVGRVDESTTGFSEGTYASDRAVWGAFMGESFNNPNLVEIPSSSAEVWAAAEALIENTDYAAFAGPFGANSNSASQAIGNRAAGFPLGVPGWPSRVAPGAWSWREIQFRRK